MPKPTRTTNSKASKKPVAKTPKAPVSAASRPSAAPRMPAGMPMAQPMGGMPPQPPVANPQQAAARQLIAQLLMRRQMAQRGGMPPGTPQSMRPPGMPQRRMPMMPPR